MEELELYEDHERQIVTIKTPKRTETIKVYVPWNGYATWKICYDNGQPIPDLSGSYLSRKQAIEAVKFWLSKQKMSPMAKAEAWFGPDQKKQLKRKQVRGTKAKTDSS